MVQVQRNKQQNKIIHSAPSVSSSSSSSFSPSRREEEECIPRNVSRTRAAPTCASSAKTTSFLKMSSKSLLNSCKVGIKFAYRSLRSVSVASVACTPLESSVHRTLDGMGAFSSGISLLASPPRASSSSLPLLSPRSKPSAKLLRHCGQHFDLANHLATHAS